VSSQIAASVFDQASPGVFNMIGISLIGGFIATVFAVAIAYYGSIATFRLGLDPDNHGVPMLTSSMDLVGAFALILAIVLLGVA
jgi:mgtE-like transporter